MFVGVRLQASAAQRAERPARQGHLEAVRHDVQHLAQLVALQLAQRDAQLAPLHLGSG
jgi:hypothetical protein